MREVFEVRDGGRVVLVARRVFVAPFDRVELARAIHALVQSLPYVEDPAGEWLQGAAWTVTHGGDCEDLHSFGRRCFVAATIPAELLWLRRLSSARDHVGLRAAPLGAWDWSECTIAARYGESPYDAERRLRVRGVELRGVM